MNPENNPAITQQTTHHKEASDKGIIARQAQAKQERSYKTAINEAKEQAIKALQEISTSEGLSPLQVSTKILSPLFPVLVFKLVWLALEASTTKSFQACMKDIKDLGIVYKEEARQADEVVKVLGKLTLPKLTAIRDQIRSPEDYYRIFGEIQSRQIEEAEVVSEGDDRSLRELDEQADMKRWPVPEELELPRTGEGDD